MASPNADYGTSDAAAVLAEPWVDAADTPPSFPECGGCFRRLGPDEVFGNESHPPYGYCADCDVFTTWPATRKGVADVRATR